MPAASFLVQGEHFQQHTSHYRPDGRVFAESCHPGPGLFFGVCVEYFQGAEQQLVASAEVVLQQARGHPGFGRDLSQGDLLESAAYRQSPHRFGDLTAA